MKSLKTFFLLAAMLLVVTSCATQYKSKPTMRGGCRGWNDPSSMIEEVSPNSFEAEAEALVQL